jgi:hypothetical protein
MRETAGCCWGCNSRVVDGTLVAVCETAVREFLTRSGRGALCPLLFLLRVALWEFGQSGNS